jgi:hypothetical protein
MSVGWQLIHAHLVAEGCGRKWSVAAFGEELNITGWREGNAMSVDEEEEDQLGI